MVKYLEKDDGYSSLIYKAQKLGTAVQHLTIKLTSISAGDEVNPFHSGKNVSHPRNWFKTLPTPSSGPCLKKKKKQPESLIERDNQWLGYHSPYEGEYYVCKDLYNKHNSALLLKVSMTKGETVYLPLMLPV